MSLEDLISIRRNKIDNIREMGINPYPYNYDPTHSTTEVVEKFDTLSESQNIVRIAGRLRSIREHGKSTFANIVDEFGSVQIYIRKNDVGEESFNLFSMLDLGDIIGIQGTMMKTRTGEVTLKAQEFKILCKTLRPLPDKWHGLRDVETRYRQRYLDLIMNFEIRKVFKIRAEIINIIRDILNSKGALEVETPVLQPIYC